jgi:hypothetical protein
VGARAGAARQPELGLPRDGAHSSRSGLRGRGRPGVRARFVASLNTAGGPASNRTRAGMRVARVPWGEVWHDVDRRPQGL